MRITHALVQVAMTLLDDDEPRRWGYEISKASGARSGVIYPMLNRMIDKKWLTDGREDALTAAAEGRPPRRYFEVTEQGKREMACLLESAARDARFSGLRDQLHKALAVVEAPQA
jgi:PadR family transcriptional regulator PadR